MHSKTIYAIHENRCYCRPVLCETKELIGLEPVDDPGNVAAFKGRRRLHKTKHAASIFYSEAAAWEAAVAVKAAEVAALKSQLELAQAELDAIEKARKENQLEKSKET